MATVQINTAQNVTLNYDVASVGARMLAGLLDVIFMYAYVLLIFYFLDATDLLVDIEEWQFIILILPYLFYHFILELLFNGQSF
ncbi:MAG TPA: RDD family protein, partial [Flavobacteriales bacterium]|nr:RDD family protein [Flavobacteriales bacterium]